MIDMHCHILPSLDDGASSWEESYMMAQMALDSGVQQIVATPHCNLEGYVQEGYAQAICKQLKKMQTLVQASQLPLQIYTGMEVFVTPKIPQLIRNGELLTLANSRYLLVEFAFGESFAYANQMLAEIAKTGLVPVVAHPERYTFIQQEPERLFGWATKGYLLQLNKGSVYGFFGKRARQTAHWCLNEGCVHLIASDAHSPYRRTTRMEDIYSYISEYNAPEIADFLLQDNPQAILNNEQVLPVFQTF